MQYRKSAWVVITLCAFLALQGCSKDVTPDFQHLSLPKSANYFLMCPQQYCNIIPSAYSPVYPVSAEDLFTAWNQMIAKQKYVIYTASMPEQGQYELMYRSWFFNFPDDISVQFIALPDNQSTLAIYSKSRYGYYDFGSNKRRILSWLELLNQQVQKMQLSAATG